MSQSWLEISFVISNNQMNLEDISDTLEEIGAISSSFEANAKTEDDIDCELLPGEEPKWAELKVTSLFAKDSDVNALKTQLMDIFSFLEDKLISTKIILDTDWQKNFRQEFSPKQFGKIWVYPSWHELPEERDNIMVLDPGLAFGTGSHPTTSLCLQWLSEQDLKDSTVIDFGCGSGILSIGASLLGAKQVFAIDHDEQALISTRQNAQNNGIGDNKIITMHSSDVDSFKRKADFLVANILFEPLLKLKNTFLSLLNENSMIAMSGILHEQEKDLKKEYENSLNSICLNRIDSWSLLSGLAKE